MKAMALLLTGLGAVTALGCNDAEMTLVTSPDEVSNHRPCETGADCLGLGGCFRERCVSGGLVIGAVSYTNIRTGSGLTGPLTIGLYHARDVGHELQEWPNVLQEQKVESPAFPVDFDFLDLRLGQYYVRACLGAEGPGLTNRACGGKAVQIKRYYWASGDEERVDFTIF